MESARHLRAIAGRARASDGLNAGQGRVQRAARHRDGGLVEDALGALVSALSLLVPGAVTELEEELDARLARIPTELNEYGYDPWGMSPATLRHTTLLTALLYRYYFRVSVEGIENFPSGRMLLIANHAGQLPFDAAMLMCA